MIKQLTSIISASGKVQKQDGKSVGILTLTTEHGDVSMTLADFDNIYRGMVKCWPTIKPLKEEVIVANRAEVAAEREELKVTAKAEKEKAKAKAKADREAKAAAAKAKGSAKEQAARQKELARLLKSAGVVDVAEAKTKSEEKGADGKLVAKPGAIKKYKAVIVYSARLDKLESAAAKA